MSNAKKQLFFGRKAYPSITCSICNSLEPNMWLYVLLNMVVPYFMVDTYKVQTFSEINIIAIQHVMFIILHKRRLENNEPLPIDRNPS